MAFADIDTLTGGFNSGHLDPVGFKGEKGNYTDLETQQAGSGLYTALSGPGGASYYDPLTGVSMARDAADSANEYWGLGRNGAENRVKLLSGNSCGFLCSASFSNAWIA